MTHFFVSGTPFSFFLFLFIKYMQVDEEERNVEKQRMKTAYYVSRIHQRWYGFFDFLVTLKFEIPASTKCHIVLATVKETEEYFTLSTE